ncbi:MAG: phosphoribosylglycinamide formyltransferase [Ignavibacteriaceae bacterium]|nr:phosphoribosylglycinamide formyltransferase [Ignavibacteriaceae bacterium]
MSYIRMAVFVSGRGSNMEALIKSEELREVAEVKLVVSDKSECKAFEIARKYKIKYVSVFDGDKSGFISYEKLLEIMAEAGINLVILAGFLKMIPKKLIQEYPWKIINIHPALLPLFGGKGMYGMNVHSAVYASGMKISGATVHYVNEKYDDGLIILQRAVNISDVISPEQIAERVLRLEHELLPEVVSLIVRDKIKIVDNRVMIS